MASKVVLRASAIVGLADGDPVSTWNDESGNGNNATQATSTKRPLYRTGGGTPYLEFDGVDDFLSIPYAFTAGQAFTIYARVWSTETGATYRNLFDGPSSSANPMVWFDTAGKVEYDQGAGRSSTAQRGAWVDVQITHPAGSAAATYYVNGVVVAGGATYSTPAYTPSWFNRGGTSTWKGRVSDIRVYDTVLTPAEVAGALAGESWATAAVMREGTPLVNGVPTYPTAVRADSPWGYWRQEETAGTTLADESGNGRAMTITGSPTLNQAGPVGRATLWPANTGVYARTAATIPTPTGVTLEAWVYLTANPSGRALVMQIGDFATGGGFNNAALWVDSTGKPSFYYYNGAPQILTGGTALALNTWHHIVGAATTSAGRLRVNKTTVATLGTGIPGSYNQTVWLHAGYNATAEAITIAEPAIYTTALSDTRIDAHFDAVPGPITLAGEAFAASAAMLGGTPRVGLRVAGDPAVTAATMLDGTIPVSVPITVAGEAWGAAATMLDGTGSLRVAGEPWVGSADFLGGNIVGAPIVASGEPWASAATMLDGFAFTPPPRNGLGLILDSSAVLTVDAPLEPAPPVPPGTPSTVLHIIAPTVPVPTLVAGRPQ